MQHPIYQVDAFTDRVFGGNPAAVVPLEAWLPDPVLQAVAAENNLSETAFLVPRGERFDLRWFTPTIEVDLCGHATLAAARVVLDHLRPGSESVRFDSRSGELVVHAEGGTLRMDFPAYPPEPVPAPDSLLAALGTPPVELLASPVKFLAVYEDEEQVRALTPDRDGLMAQDRLGVIATAPAADPKLDFVSRFFAPKAGVYEDPVTGSAHCVSTPYWSKRLGKAQLHARQISARGGELWCEDRGERIWIRGQAVTYLEGRIALP